MFLSSDLPQFSSRVGASWYKKIFHWNEFGPARDECLDKMKEIFRNKAPITDPKIFEKTWDRAKARFGWKMQESLNPELMERQLKEILVYSGKGIQTEGAGSDPQIHEVVQFLLGKGAASSEWLNARNAKGILLREDPALLEAMKNEFQIAFSSLADQVDKLTKEQEPVFEAFVNNLIALLPYCYPKKGDEFLIPQKIAGVWRCSKYRINEKIELTPKWFSTPIAAYGLVSDGWPPILTFLGTTFPAGDGFVATVLADFTPGFSVGHAPYLMGKSKIEEWMRDKQGVRLYGMSLGGALAFHTLRNHKEKIGSADVFNPPGLYPWNWKEEIEEKVNIYYQENDVVATMGSFPEGRGVSVFHVHPEERENPLKAHARIYSGKDKVTILEGDSRFENRRPLRKFLTGLHMILGAVLFFLPVLFSYFLYSITVRPLKALSRLPNLHFCCKTR